VWKWTYGLRRVLTATDPNNKITTTTYHPDADSDFGKRGQVATVTSPLGHARQFTAYDAAGRLTTMADPNGVVSSMTYDLRGRLASRTVGGELTTTRTTSVTHRVNSPTVPCSRTSTTTRTG
jgi:YD repeat-containing protein